MAAPVDTDSALKDRHRAMWALGDYPAVATDLILELGTTLVSACGVQPGQRVLDVAAGSGNAAIPAALAGAQVVACDLTPEMLDAGRQAAARQGAELAWRQGDAEALPFGDGEFHTVMSCVGVMFAPHHQASADELLRVCRRGGTIGLISWTPAGFIGQMLTAMKPFLAPPPPRTQPAILWGEEDHVRSLFGPRVHDLTTQRRTVTIDHFATPEQFRDYFKANYGPTVAAYRAIADDPDKVAALDTALDELARRADRGTGRTVMDWEYLLVTARKSG
jgi:ubiquinone/menaquinone biosynthesis C-methylase UbiE